MSGTVASCPLCGDAFVDHLAYTDHLRDVHDLVDDDGVQPHTLPPGAVGLHADALASAAAILARPEPDEPLAPPVPGPVPADAPATSRRRRPTGLVAALALAAILLVGGMKALSSPDRPDLDAGDGATGGQAVTDGGITPGADGSLGGLAVTTTSSPPPTTAPPTTATAPSQTTAPPAPPPPTTPPATTPAPTPPGPTTVRAVQASVVSCARDGGTRTLVYSYVLSGSADDGPRQERLVARGRLVVASVRAPVPGGGSVVVPLEPGPVDCS